MVTPRSPLDDLAEQVAGPGTRVRDPRAFTKFLLEGADSYEIASLEEQALAKGVDLSPVRAWASNPQEVIQGYKQRLAAITPEVQASQAERGQAFTRRGINPFGVDPFGQQSILSNTGVQLGMAAATPYRFAAGEIGAAIGSEGAKAAGLGPNWQMAGGIVGGVAGGAPEVPVALTKGAVRGGAAVGRGAGEAIGSYRSTPPLPEGTVPPRQASVTTRTKTPGMTNEERLIEGMPIGRGKRVALDRLDMEVRMGKLSPDVADPGRDFIKAVPDRYFDRLGTSYRQGGAAIGGTYDPNTRLMTIAREVANNSDKADEIIIHEVSHHLQTHLSASDASTLFKQFTRDAARNKNAVGQTAYRNKNFPEWFAETIKDKALRDYYKEPSTSGALGRAWETIQDIATATVQWLRNMGRADEAELVYRKFLAGEQPVLDRTPGGGVLEFADQPPESAVTKLIRVIKAERPARGPTERMRSIERAKRAGAGAEALKQGSDPEAAFRSALGQQRGELPTAVSHGIPDTDFTPADVSELLDKIRGHGRIRFYEKLSTRTALYKAINYAAGETDQLPAPHEFELLEEVFGRDLASALQSRKGNLGRLALEVMGIPKTLRSSIDLSAPMRQGVFLSGRHPKEWVQAWGPMFKSLKSDRAALESYDRILADPDYQEIVGSVIPSRQRLSIVNPTGDALNMGARSANEEVFISRLANKIPGIRASNRAYTTYLNELRYNVAKTTLNNWKKAGVDVTPEKMDMLGRFINISTGRGRLGKLEQISPALSATFWSPRLLSSRFETPTLALQALKAGDKEIARLAAEELAAFVGMGVTALTLISLSGIGRVELDPRSSDFGKIRIGGTSLDFWGGFQQMARYTAQFMTSERKPLTKNDVLVDPAKAGMEPVQRSETAFNFLRSKLAPGVPSLLGNEMTNRTFTGDPYSEKVKGKTVQTTRPALGFNDAPEINTRLDEAVQQMTPLFLLELTRSIENDGLEGALRTAPGITGVGVQSIPTTDARQDTRTNKW